MYLPLCSDKIHFFHKHFSELISVLHQATVKLRGGKQVTDFEIIPKVGKFAYFEDTEGNMFGVLQWKGYM